MTGIKGAIFDMDGTVLDSMRMWEDLGSLFLKKKGIEPEKDLKEKLFAMSMEEGAVYLRDRYLSEERPEDIIKELIRMAEDFYRNEVTLKEGTAELLKFFRERGICCIAATSSDRECIRAALLRENVLEYFEDILTCTEVGEGKTSPAIYEKAAQRIGTRPEETLVFEDMAFALRTAKEAGFCTVGVYDSCSESEEDEKRKFSDLYLASMHDFRRNFY